jgi:hypothetical protein
MAIRSRLISFTRCARWVYRKEAYEVALSKTSTRHAPWFVIPSNHKWFRNLAVSQILMEALESLRMKFPAPSVDIEEIRRRNHAVAKIESKK